MCTNPEIGICPNIEAIHLGTKRPSMKKNHLLQKPEVEKPLDTGKDLPGYGFTYGLPYIRRDGGVQEALWWRCNPEGKCRRPPVKKKPDFISMNRAAITLGLTRSADQDVFRRKHPMYTTCPRGKKLPRSYTVPDITFGRKYPPKTPMPLVINHSYRNSFILDRFCRDKRVEKLTAKPRDILGSIIYNRAARFAAHRPPPTPQLMKTNPKLEKVPPTLDTFRDECSKKLALEKQLCLEAELAKRNVKDEEPKPDVPIEQKILGIGHVVTKSKSYSLYSFNPDTRQRRLMEPPRDPLPRPKLFAVKQPCSRTVALLDPPMKSMPWWPS